MMPLRSLRTAAALGLITLAGALVLRLQLDLTRDTLAARAGGAPGPVAPAGVREAPADPLAVPLADSGYSPLPLGPGAGGER